MDANALRDENEQEEEFSESFVCCVCLDLLYKPIVLSCGHVSCFWCVHKSMDGMHESRCPICRHPYYHFPTICQMLHFLLLKIYPIAYKRRENQMLEEEKKTGYFSPQFDAYTYGSQAKFDHSGSSPSSTISDSISNSCSVKFIECMEPSGSDTREGKDSVMFSEHNQQQKVSIADMTCTKCKQLLFLSVVLNCGHVYCEACIINQSDEMLRCQVCQSPHPKGFPKVCLALDHFLEEQFPEEYAKRRDAVQLHQIKVKPETTSCSSDNGEVGKINWWSGLGSNVHIGVGCDFCGMYPITGDRYRCIDCKEKIGFDLCGDCYNTRSKLPGRFNQQHAPEHKFEHVEATGLQRSLENLELIYEDPSLTDDGEELE